MKMGESVLNTSTFLSVEKDFELIVGKMLKNNNLKKLLFYQNTDALDQPILTQEETLGLLNKSIRLVPKLEVDAETMSYVIIGFDNFTPNSTNTEFRDNIVSFDIICHFDNWILGDYQLRPYKILGEIDGLFNNKHLTGIGTLRFLGANQLILNDKLGGFSLTYAAIHGDEDKATRRL